ncbi:MAG: M36 family metallopeptidase, partial [Bryobacteraceae bacterium]
MPQDHFLTVRRRFPWTALAVGLLIAVPGWSQTRNERQKGALPSFDIRDAEPRGEPTVGQQNPARALVEQRKGMLDAFLRTAPAGTRLTANSYGLPKLLLREGGVLSARSTLAPEEIARGFLRSHASLFPLAPPEVDQLRLLVKDSAGAGPTFLAFNQTLDGIDVYNGQIKFTLTAAGEVVQVAAADVVPQLRVGTIPELDAQAAVKAALRAIKATPPAELSAFADPDGKVAFRNPLGDGYRPISAELFILPLTASSARLAYRIYLEADRTTWYEILIDAQNGDLLYRHNLYVWDGKATVWTTWPTTQGSRESVTIRTTPVASDSDPGPWLPSSGTNSRGNNAWAFFGTVDDAYMGLASFASSASQNFDFPFGDGLSGQDPRLFHPAEVTNMFYFVNLAHDYYYSLGFTEAAGNFQADNYGRGGAANDPVLASAESLTDNAAFAPTPDGTAPELLLGIFTRGTPFLTDDLDFAYDGQAIFHEYGHGVSNRLVGARVSTSCLDKIQSGAMGEGWSDYFGISYFNNPVFGSYETQDFVNGIRRHSYEAYPYTYEDLGNGLYGYEVHDDGEIWAAALWELRKSVGQAVADQLVVDGLKSTPCNPLMTNARDAILSADQARYGGANRAAIWRAFAKHGLGYSAFSVDGDYETGFRYDAAYDQPPDLQATQNPAITSNPLTVSTSAGDSYAYTVAASNPNGGTLNFALDSGPPGMTVNSATGAISWNASFFGQRVKIAVTDGKGGKVVHSYLLPVKTGLVDGVPVAISGPTDYTGDAVGYARFTVPANATVLQFTLRGGTGDADLNINSPGELGWSSSDRIGNNETLSFANPAAGTWQVVVDGWLAYSGVSLTATLITPTPIDANTSLPSLSGAEGSETFYRVTVPSGAPRFAVTASGGTGSLGFFMSVGSPAVCSGAGVVQAPCTYGYLSETTGNPVSIVVVPWETSNWYIDLYASSAYSGVTLTTSTAPLAPPPPLAIATPSPLATGQVGQSYFQTISATGGAGYYRLSLASGALPGGLGLSDGVINGWPTSAGVFSFTLRVADNAGATATAAFTLTISPVTPPSIVMPSSALPAGFVGVAYSLTLSTTGGITPFSWSLAWGVLPAGLTLTSDGAILGTPTTAGYYSFTIRVQDWASATGTTTFTLTVAAAGPPAITRVAGNGVGGFSGDGGQATSAQLNGPYGVAVDGAGNLYIADAGNNRVRKVSPDWTITTVAGSTFNGFWGDGGQATSAELDYPHGVAVDRYGNLYIADSSNNCVRLVAPNGIITTVAGTGVAGSQGDSGQATVAQLNYPAGVALDGSGNLYIADENNHRVRKVQPNGIITTVAGMGVPGYSGDGGPAAGAQLSYPTGVALDGSGNLYIADAGNNRVRKVAPNGTITTVAGSTSRYGSGGYSGDGGPATNAQLSVPYGVAVDDQGNVYISDSGNSVLRKVSLGGIITTVGINTGEGGAAAQLISPTGVAVAANGNIYVADGGVYVLLIYSTAGAPPSVVTTSPLPQSVVGAAYSQTFSASGGSSPYVWSVASGAIPFGLALAGDGTLSGTPTTAGTFTFTIRVEDRAAAAATATFALTIALPASPLIPRSSVLPVGFVGAPYSQTLSATGGSSPYTWSLASGPLPDGLTLSGEGTISGTPSKAGSYGFAVRVQDGDSAATTKAFTLTVMAAGTSFITTVAGTGILGYSGDGAPAVSAQLGLPGSVAVDGSGSLYIVDQYQYNDQRIRKVALSSGIITTVVATGLYHVDSVVLDGAGNLYVADGSNYSQIYRLDLSSGLITLVAGGGASYPGDGGPAASASLAGPVGMTFDGSGNLYIADYGHNRIRKVSPDGIITTVVGNGSYGYSGDGGPATDASLAGPSGVAVDGSGNLYFADKGNNRIRKVASSSGIITTVAGGGDSYPGDGGPPTSAYIIKPTCVAVDGSGNLYFSDSFGGRIVKLSPSGVIATVAGGGNSRPGDGGPATGAHLDSPDGVALDASGNLYIGDSNGHRVRLVQAAGVAPVSVVTTSPLPQGSLGAAYSQTLTATGGAPPYTWSVTSSAVPPGLALTSGGTISGTPTMALTRSFTVQVTDNAAATAFATFVVTILAPCSYSISPTSLSIPGAGETGTIDVTAPVGCSWSASNSLGWVAITSRASGTGSGSVAYQVAANGATARSGSITVAGQSVSITQSALLCTYSLYPAGQAFSIAGGTGTIAVTAPAGCAWSVSGLPPWVVATGG